MKIYPSLLAADLSDLKKVFKQVETVSCAGVHLDVMDGNFVSNQAFDLDCLKKIKQETKLPLDFHFMVKTPATFIMPYLQFNPTRIAVQIEEKPSAEFFEFLKENGISAGIVVDLPTQIEMIFPFLQWVDYVVVMAVKCGASGQSFSPQTWDKIKWVQRHFKGEIVVDGGIRFEMIPDLEEAGVQSVVMGAGFFNR